MTEKLLTGRMTRALDTSERSINEKTRTVELTFSSEYPAVRTAHGMKYVEILDHSPSSIRLDRMNDRAPVLVDHDPRDHVGTVEKVAVGQADRKARAMTRFGRSARAEEIWQDVRDGIKSHVSVGYIVHRMVEDKAMSTPDLPAFRVVDWTPIELSITSVPLDPTVGIGRSAGGDGGGELYETILLRSEEMSESQSSAVAQAPAVPSINIEEVRNEARTAELDRVKALDTVGREFKQFGGEELARQCIAEGKGVDDLRGMLLERVGKRQTPNMGEIGLSQREKQDFRITRLIHAICHPTDKQAQRAAAFEFECSAAALQAEKRSLRAGAQVVIPYDVLAFSQRDLLAGTSTIGGYSVGTDLLGAAFVDLLKNRTFAIAAGAQVLSGLQGNVAIPTLTTSATAYWVAENTAPTEGAMNFGQITLSPKMLGAYVDVSRRLVIQSSIDVENFVRGELASQIAVELDRVILNGAGTGSEPAGILASTSVGTSTAGSNGAAPAWSHFVGLETLVAAANADRGALAYFLNPKTRGLLKQTVKSTAGTLGYIWDMTETPVNGYRAFVTNQVPSNLTKGTSTGSCSAALFGNFSDVIMGQWGGGVDLMVDPYTGGNAGTVRVIALTDVDVAIRRNGSFAYIKDLVTP